LKNLRNIFKIKTFLFQRKVLPKIILSERKVLKKDILKSIMQLIFIGSIKEIARCDKS